MIIITKETKKLQSLIDRIKECKTKFNYNDSDIVKEFLSFDNCHNIKIDEILN
jgi:hypothetical protein